SIPAKVSLPAPAQTLRSLDVSVAILPFFLFGFLLARFAAPLFKLLPACTFRQVTGVPCPSCGATRAGLALAQGDLMVALSYNPLLVISLSILFGWSVFCVFEKWSGKSISRRLSKMMAKTFGEHFGSAKFKMRQRLRWLALGATVLNWVYLIVTT
ncbi:MAG: DUF2752 domain-containing protein, partial [bacterium]